VRLCATLLWSDLELLKTLPDTLERAQQELALQVALGVPLTATRGQTSLEGERAHTRARELCQQLGQPPQLFPTLYGLWGFYFVRGELPTTRELGEQLLSLAQREQDPALLMDAHRALERVLYHLGEFAPAREHCEQALALYNSQRRGTSAFNPGVSSLSLATLVLWHLGYPDQALKKSQEALTLAQTLSHPLSLVYALGYAVRFHQPRREKQAVQERAEAALTLATEQGFPFWLGLLSIQRGWVLAEQGQVEEGITQIRQGIAAYQAARAELDRPYYLALLAEAYGKVRQIQEGLTVLAEALAVVNKNGERLWEPELYRLQGELTLQKFQVSGFKFQVNNPQAAFRNPQLEEAEECFHRAIEIARKQRAKSLELRAVMSLSRLWQQQGKKEEARQMLAETYGWFTEGFDTKDLQEAKALLDELTPRLAVESSQKEPL